MSDSKNFVVNAARGLGAAAGKIASFAGVAAEDDAISLLKKDHDTVKELFDQFETTANHSAKRKIVRQALIELKVHAAIEEDLFYPAIRRRVGDDLMNEAGEEHHVAKLLIAELETLAGNAPHYDAKFVVLSENVRHHIKEEENEIFPKAKSLDLDFKALGQAMLDLRNKLLADGVPATPEERMVTRAAAKPAKPARRKPAAKPRRKQ